MPGGKLATLDCCLAGTNERLHHRGGHIERLAIGLLEQVILFDEGEQKEMGASIGAAQQASIGGKFAVGVAETVQGDTQLLQIVGAAHPVGGVAHFLHGGN